MELPYRQNAAVIITDGQGRVLLCRRVADALPLVQTVQGGVDEGETSKDAAIREMHEEVGLTPEKFTIIGEASEKYRYDFRSEMSGMTNIGKNLERYRGQEQTFFLAQVDPNVVFDLAAHSKQEFQEVWWGTPEEFVREAWDLKRPGIEMALRAFGLLA